MLPSDSPEGLLAPSPPLVSLQCPEHPEAQTQQLPFQLLPAMYSQYGNQQHHPICGGLGLDRALGRYLTRTWEVRLAMISSAQP